MANTAESFLPTAFGDFRILTFSDTDLFHPHVVLVSAHSAAIPTIRIHSECLTGDVFASLRCDCGDQLHAAMQLIQQNGGALLYLRQEGRGIGLTEKIKAYALQEQGHDTYTANELLGHGQDERDFNIVLEMLQHLGWNKVNIITNNPEKVSFLESHGIEVNERIPLVISANAHNVDYLAAKKKIKGHLL
jgi:GTP cyclohydrolase II